MDLSKLPRLSKTDAPPPPDDAGATAGGDAPMRAFEVVQTSSAPAAGYCHCGAPLRAGARFCDSCGAPVASARAVRAFADGVPDAGIGADVWISIALGLLLIFMSPRIWQYYLTPGSFTWTFSDADGNPLEYRQTMFYWGDLALAGFAVTLIFEGIAMAFRRRRLIMVALAVTVVTTVLNLAYVAAMMSKGFGFQLYSGLAVAFGVYIAIAQWKMLQLMRFTARA